MRLFTILLVLISCTAYSQEPVGHISLDSFYRMKAERDKEFTGKPYPVFKAVNEKGEICNDSLIGNVVLINFWFAACPPCVAEMDALNKLYRQFKSHKNFRIISFTFESPQQLIQLKRKFHMLYPVYSISNQECYRLNRNNGFPTSIILDKAGIIKYITYGGSTDKMESEFIVLKEIVDEIERQLSISN